MKKKINSLLVIFLITMVFVGCAGNAASEEEIVIPSTMEERAAISSFIPVTDAAQIEGVWLGEYTQAMTGAETGLPFDVEISADVSLEYPVSFKNVNMIQYTEKADYTAYLEKLAEATGMDAAAVWALMVNQFEGIEYTTEAPYIITMPNFIQPTDTEFLSALFVSEDGKQIKIVAGIGFEFYLEKQN